MAMAVAWWCTAHYLSDVMSLMSSYVEGCKYVKGCVRVIVSKRKRASDGQGSYVCT